MCLRHYAKELWSSYCFCYYYKSTRLESRKGDIKDSAIKDKPGKKSYRETLSWEIFLENVVYVCGECRLINLVYLGQVKVIILWRETLKRGADEHRWWSFYYSLLFRIYILSIMFGKRNLKTGKGNSSEMFPTSNIVVNSKYCKKFDFIGTLLCIWSGGGRPQRETPEFAS